MFWKNWFIKNHTYDNHNILYVGDQKISSSLLNSVFFPNVGSCLGVALNPTAWKEFCL